MIKLGNNTMRQFSTPEIVSSLLDRLIRVQVGSLPGLTLTIRNDFFDAILLAECPEHATRVIELSNENQQLQHIRDALNGATQALCESERLHHCKELLSVPKEISNMFVSLLSYHIESEGDFKTFYEDEYEPLLIDAAHILIEAYKKEYDAVIKQRAKYAPSIPVKIDNGKLTVFLTEESVFECDEESTSSFLDEFKTYVNDAAPGHIMSLQENMKVCKESRTTIHDLLNQKSITTNDEALHLIKCWQKANPYYY
jgi:hypothetical protein